jgi:O-antigen/teichoic acid export membrane protein
MEKLEAGSRFHLIGQLREKFLASKFSRDVIWNLASLAVLAVGGFSVNLVIARFAGEDVLGVFNQVFAAYIILSQFGVGGLQYSTLKNISYHQEEPEVCAEVTASALLLVLVLGGVISVAGYLLADQFGAVMQSPAVAVGMRYAMPGLLFFSLNKVLMMTLNGLRHMRAYAIFQALRYILIPGGIAGMILAGLPGNQLPIVLTLTEVVLFLCLAPYIKSFLPFPKSFQHLKAWFPSHISYGVRGFMSGALAELNTRVDVLLLGYFGSDATVGVYSFAATVGEGFGQLAMALRYNVDPIMGACFARDDKESIEKYAKKIQKIFYPAAIAIGIAAIALFPVVFGVLVKKQLAYDSWGVFAILAVGIMLNAGFRPFYGIILQGGRPGMHTIFIAILVISNAILCLCLIPVFGIYGAALATSSVYVLEAVLISRFARGLFGVKLS